MKETIATLRERIENKKLYPSKSFLPVSEKYAFLSEDTFNQISLDAIFRGTKCKLCSETLKDKLDVDLHFRSVHNIEIGEYSIGSLACFIE